LSINFWRGIQEKSSVPKKTIGLFIWE
jgi:hypothetical protein